MPAAGPDRIRVLIADDHALFRRGLIMVLEAEPDIEVVAEAQDGTEVIGKAEEFVPDVLLMDVRMPKLNGIEAARAIRESVPSAKIVMLTVSDEEDDLFDAIKAGANGYLLKEISIEEVADAIRSVVQGQSLISPSMASKLLNEFNTLAKQPDECQGSDGHADAVPPVGAVGQAEGVVAGGEGGGDQSVAGATDDRRAAVETAVPLRGPGDGDGHRGGLIGVQLDGEVLRPAV